MINQDELLSKLCNFLQESPTSYHVTDQSIQILQQHGFKPLNEKDSWNLKPQGKYYITRGGGSLAAFNMSGRKPKDNGLSIVGAHTDSPSLKLKPNPLLLTKGYQCLAVEIYGSPIISTWFDRGLSIAGRVNIQDDNKQIQTKLIDFKNPVAIIPNLAIHLQDKDHGKNINKQKEIVPLLFQNDPKSKNISLSFNKIINQELKKQLPKDFKFEILDSDLFLYDTQAPQLTGLKNEFLQASRLDNQISCFTALHSFLEAKGSTIPMIVLNDHEEVGSSSNIGAGGTMLKTLIKRICGESESYHQALARSFLISADNAHAIHPNYSEQYDDHNAPAMNQGPVIKYNASQKYSTTSFGSSIFKIISKNAGCKHQVFAGHNNLRCGSTIGPITSTVLGIETIDIGIASLGMHSIRETCGANDIHDLYRVLKEFFNSNF